MRVSLILSLLFFTLQCLSVHSIDTTSSGTNVGPDAPDVVTDRVKPGGYASATAAGGEYTMCDWYTEYLFGSVTPVNSYSYLQLVLDAAFNGYEEDGDTANGLFTSPVTADYFNGNVDFRASGETPNYITDSSAALALREKLIDYFARDNFLSCTAFVNLTYQGGRQYEYIGNENIFEVHRRAKIGKPVFETFNAIVVGAFESYYMETVDAAVVAALLAQFTLGSGQETICTQYNQETPNNGCTIKPGTVRFRFNINLPYASVDDTTAETVRQEICDALGFAITGQECAKVQILYLNTVQSGAAFLVEGIISETNSGDNTATTIFTSLRAIISNPGHAIYSGEGLLASANPLSFECVPTSTTTCKSCAALTISNILLVVLALLAYLMQ